MSALNVSLIAAKRMPLLLSVAALLSVVALPAAMAAGAQQASITTLPAAPGHSAAAFAGQSGAMSAAQAVAAAQSGALGTTPAAAAQAGSGPLPVPLPSPDPRRVPPAKPGALTLHEVLALAHDKNPALLAARQNLEATRAQEVQAGVRVNPNVSIAGQEITLGQTNPASPYTYEATMSRLFERGQKRRWRLDGARATTEQTAAQLHDQERGTELAVKQAFTAMLIAKASLALSNDNLADFRHEVDINHDRYQAGDIGKLDFERLDLQLAQFESDQSAAEISVRQASDQLQTLMGIEEPQPDFDVTGDIVPPALGFDLPALDAKALAVRPDYLAAVAGVAVADAGVKLAYANGTTDPTLEGEYDRTSIYNSAGFNVSIPLRIFDRNQGNKETSKFAAQSSRFAVVAAKNQVLSDVDQAWIGYTQSKVLADRYSGHYLDEASDVLQIAQFAYEHGGIALIDYLDALRDSRAATAAALGAYANTWLAIHQLSYAAAAEVNP